MKNIFAATFIIAATVLSGCGQNGDKAPSPNVPHFVCSTAKTSPTQSPPWQCAKEACQSAGATWASSSNSCSCAAGQLYIGGEYPRCRSQDSIISERSNSSIYLISNGLDTAFDIRGDLNLMYLTGPTKVIVPQDFPYVIDNGPVYVNVYDHAPKDDVMKKLLRGAFTTLQEDKTGVAFFITDSEISQLFQSLVTGKLSLKQDQPAQLPARTKEALAALPKFQMSAPEFEDARGCNYLCTTKGDLKLPSGPARLIKYYAEGRLLYSELFLLRNDSFLQGLPEESVVLFPNNLVSHYISYALSKDMFSSNVTVRASDYQVLWSGNIELIDTAASDVLKSARQNERFSEAVTMCDTHLYSNSIIKQGLKNNLVLGPYSSDNIKAGASLLGYQKSSTYEEAAEGLQDKLNDRGLPRFMGMIADSFAHSTAVGSLIAAPLEGEEERIGIYAPGTVDCFEKLDQLALKTKIVNVSVQWSEQSKCDETSPWSKFQSPYLWVVAAGNEGQFVRQSSMCPDRLSGAANMIIVGAVENGKVASYSNYGADFVDIYAEGNELAGQKGFGNGTSLATPRVSHVAAVVASRFSKLSNEDIRYAILLGAQGSGLPARSGGTLSLSGALKVAELRSQNLSFHEILNRLNLGENKFNVLKSIGGDR